MMQCWSPSSRASPGRTREKTFTLPFTLMVVSPSLRGDRDEERRNTGQTRAACGNEAVEAATSSAVTVGLVATRAKRVVMCAVTNDEPISGTTRQGARGGEAGAVIRGAYLSVSCNLSFRRG